MLKTLKHGLIAAAALAVSAGAAMAEWPDKPIKFIVGYSPGGGFDAYARALAPELEKSLGVEVVVENVPGAGGQKGAATIYRADPDGYTIGIWNIPGLTVPQLLGKANGFDLNDVTWLATLGNSRYALAVKADSEYQKLEDLCSLGRPFKHSDTGPASTSSVTAYIAMNLIDCPIINVTGYKGSSDTIVALMRGEVDATIKPIASLNKYVKSGDVRLLMTFEDTPSVEGVPSSGEAGYPDFSKFQVVRVIGGPPGIPADIAARLSEAVVAAASSDTVQEWSVSSKRPVDPVGPEETRALMDELMGFYTTYKDLLAQK
ncbi:MAG: tripartite tricarboxylate transporter substrate binding protein [Rhodobacter sp.]|nr:tripartite tricarboxylate transporter substrate binding protein [Rhodobacter sp.]